MEKLNQAAANLEGLINNTPLTSQMRNQLIEDLKSLYELAKKQTESEAPKLKK